MTSQVHCHQPKCPTLGEWINRMWFNYTMECYLAIKRNPAVWHRMNTSREHSVMWNKLDAGSISLLMVESRKRWPYGSGEKSSVSQSGEGPEEAGGGQAVSRCTMQQVEGASPGAHCTAQHSGRCCVIQHGWEGHFGCSPHRNGKCVRRWAC